MEMRESELLLKKIISSADTKTLNEFIEKLKNDDKITAINSFFYFFKDVIETKKEDDKKGLSSMNFQIISFANDMFENYSSGNNKNSLKKQEKFIEEIYIVIEKDYKLLENLYNLEVKFNELSKYSSINDCKEEEIRAFMNSLISILNYAIKNIEEKKDIDYIYKAIDLVDQIIEQRSEISYPKQQKEFLHLMKDVEKLRLEKYSKLSDENELKIEFNKLEDIIIKVNEKIGKEENKTYRLVNFIINETKNLAHLEQTFREFPNYVNLLDKNERSLFLNTTKTYIKKIVTYEDNIEDVLYYNNVISLIKSKKNFELKQEEKTECLQDIYTAMEKLPRTSLNYKKKISLLGQLKENIRNKKNFETLAVNYNIKIEFSDLLIQELKMYQTDISKINYPDRVVIDDYLITIDSASTVEIDDGLTAKILPNGNYLLGVHIASVLGYIPYESPIIHEAIQRTSSIHLDKKAFSHNSEGNKMIPIFPFEFSTNTASLVEGEYRLANSYFFELDKKGNIVNQKYMKTIIKNNRKSSYSEVNKALEKGSKNKDFEKLVKNLLDICIISEDKYRPSALYKKSKEISNDPANIIVGNTMAEMIVNQTMMITGSSIADFFAHSKEGYPCLYRVHEIDENCTKKLQDEISKISTGMAKDKFDHMLDTLLKIYPKARYDISGGHDGLNLKHYCHGTSPLRRAADIVVEHALDVCYFNNPNDNQLEILKNDIIENKKIINAKNNDIDYFLDDYNIQKRKIKKKNVK